MSSYLARPRIQIAAKALLLLALALFLYSRMANGTILFYINQNFVPYTMLAVIGLIIVAISYRPVERRTARGAGAAMEEASEGTGHSHAHNHGEHPHDERDHNHAHDHSHALTLSGLLLMALPIILGILVPPQPLGAAAMANRDVNVSLQNTGLPAAVRKAEQTNSTDRNILDWLQTFAGAQDPAHDLAGQPAKVVGFVFRDKRFGPDQFMVARYVVTCCVADATVAGIVVQSPQAASFAADQWVEVSGTFEPGKLGTEELPVLSAKSVAEAEIPAQPYLYP
jgi:putative membrane protein